MASCSLELVSFNARGLGNEKKRKKVFNILKKQTSMDSVIFLQECRSTKEAERLWEYQWKNKIFYSHEKSNARGVCTLLRPGLEYKEDTRLIWGGDWNCILDKSLDAMGESPSLKKESVKLIQNLMNDFDLVDVWRLRNPTYKNFRGGAQNQLQ